MIQFGCISCEIDRSIIEWANGKWVFNTIYDRIRWINNKITQIWWNTHASLTTHTHAHACMRKNENVLWDVLTNETNVRCLMQTFEKPFHSERTKADLNRNSFLFFSITFSERRSAKSKPCMKLVYIQPICIHIEYDNTVYTERMSDQYSVWSVQSNVYLFISTLRLINPTVCVCVCVVHTWTLTPEVWRIK